MTARFVGFVLAAVLAGFVAGCGPAVVQPPSLTAGTSAEAWQTLMQSMPAVTDPASANACGAGSSACIAAVVAEMTRRFNALDADCSREAPFSLMYLLVTRGVQSQGGARFHSQAYLNHLDAVFANLYFTAYDNWQAGRSSQVPEAWRIAFSAADRGTVTVLGALLLGMNAHISRDLPFALARTGLNEPGGLSGESDFDNVNGLLGSVTPEVLNDEASHFDPTLMNTVVPLSQLGGSTVQQLLTAWRDESWGNAQKLVAAKTPAERAAVEHTIETGAAGRARLIALLTSNLVSGPGPTQQTTYCRRYLAAHAGQGA